MAETSRVQLTYLGKGFIALVFVIGSLGRHRLVLFRLQRVQRDALQAIMDPCG